VEPLLASGALREDLYHRLAVFPVHLPPLRERRGDILPLAETLLARIAGDLGRARLALSEDVKARLVGAPWPGNVRELANALERAAIEEALAASGGNRRAAAERLGIGLRTLYDKLKKYHGDSATD
jgi:two-component system response regulator FlrC